jgi:hypothetical protein
MKLAAGPQQEHRPIDSLRSSGIPPRCHAALRCVRGLSATARTITLMNTLPKLLQDVAEILGKCKKSSRAVAAG